MRDGYRLELTDNVHLYNLVTPFGEPIVEIERHAYGFEIRPIVDGIGHTQDIHMENIDMTVDGTIIETSGYPPMENACTLYVEAHYKANTTCSEKFRNWIAAWSSIWAWLYGLIATIAAVWGWID